MQFVNRPKGPALPPMPKETFSVSHMLVGVAVIALAFCGVRLIGPQAMAIWHWNI